MPFHFLRTAEQSNIPAGTAVSWRFRGAVVLVVQRGRVWVTLDDVRSAKDVPRGGDWFLDAGMSITLKPHQKGGAGARRPCR